MSATQRMLANHSQNVAPSDASQAACKTNIAAGRKRRCGLRRRRTRLRPNARNNDPGQGGGRDQPTQNCKNGRLIIAPHVSKLNGGDPGILLVERGKAGSFQRVRGEDQLPLPPANLEERNTKNPAPDDFKCGDGWGGSNTHPIWPTSDWVPRTRLLCALARTALISPPG